MTTYHSWLKSRKRQATKVILRIGCILLLAFLALPAVAQTSIVSTLSSWNGSTVASSFGFPNGVAVDTYGQTFTVPTGYPTISDINFRVGYNFGDALTFTGYLMAWNGSEATGSVLYQSTAQTVNSSTVGLATIDFPISNLALTPGDTYVFFLLASPGTGGAATAQFGVTGNNSAYSGGNFVYTDSQGSFANLETAWLQSGANSVFGNAAFEATFKVATSTQVTVPNLVGDTQSAATTAITGAGLVVGTVTTAPSSTVASGQVISESPSAGTSVTSGAAVNLVISSGPAQVIVPTLTFAPIATQVEGAAPFAVSATSASNGAVTYAVTSGPATIAGNVVTVTGAGTVILTANQAASGGYAAATATTSFTVDIPFTLTTGTGSTAGSSGNSASVAPGAAASFSLTLAPFEVIALLDPITFSATGLPPGATATFSPTTIAAGSQATTVTLTIQTAATTARNEQPTSGNPLAPVALGFLLLPLLWMTAARRPLQKMPRLLLVLLAVGLSLGAVLGISGCAGGSMAPAATTPAQTYTVVATATDATTKAQSSMNLMLTVQ